MVEESIADGIDAADGRRLPPNSPWLRVVSGAGFVCGLAGLRLRGSPIFGPVRKRVMLRLTVLFAFLQQKYMRAMVSESTGAQAEAER